MCRKVTSIRLSVIPTPYHPLAEIGKGCYARWMQRIELAKQSIDNEAPDYAAAHALIAIAEILHEMDSVEIDEK